MGWLEHPATPSSGTAPLSLQAQLAVAEQELTRGDRATTATPLKLPAVYEHLRWFVLPQEAVPAIAAPGLTA
jgi:hypothetical protein